LVALGKGPGEEGEGQKQTPGSREGRDWRMVGARGLEGGEWWDEGGEEDSRFMIHLYDFRFLLHNMYIHYVSCVLEAS